MSGPSPDWPAPVVPWQTAQPAGGVAKAIIQLEPLAPAASTLAPPVPALPDAPPEPLTPEPRSSEEPPLVLPGVAPPPPPTWPLAPDADEPAPASVDGSVAAGLPPHPKEMRAAKISGE